MPASYLSSYTNLLKFRAVNLLHDIAEPMCGESMAEEKDGEWMHIRSECSTLYRLLHTWHLARGMIRSMWVCLQGEWCGSKPGVGIIIELSNRKSYYSCTFDDVSYVVCRVVVATPPVQVPLTQEHQNYESAPRFTVRDRSTMSTVSMNDVSHVASLVTLNLTPAELRLWVQTSCKRTCWSCRRRAYPGRI